MDLEKDVEQHLKKQVENFGGLCLKFISPGTRGVPDRLIIYNGNVLFVELKKPGGKLRPDQIKCISKFNDHFIPVFVIDSKEKAKYFAEKTMPSYR